MMYEAGGQESPADDFKFPVSDASQVCSSLWFWFLFVFIKKFDLVNHCLIRFFYVVVLF
jgi:hypothetical protein